MFRKFSVSILILLSSNFDFSIAVPQAPATEATITTMKSYDTKFDSIDVDEILKQERLLKNYVNCLENKGPCTPDGKLLKETLPDAVESNCSKCSEMQKYKSDKVTRYLIDNRPEDWDRLEKLYDPEGKYRKEYLEEKSKMAEATAS